MSKLNTISKKVMIAGVVMILSSSPAFCSMIPPYGIGLNPASDLAVNRLIHVVLFIRSDTYFDSIHVKVATYGKLEYSGERDWRVTVKPGDSLIYDLPIQLAANDTSGIVIRTERKDDGSLLMSDCLYFVTGAEEVRTWRIDPRSVKMMPEQIYPESYLQSHADELVPLKRPVRRVEGGPIDTITSPFGIRVFNVSGLVIGTPIDLVLCLRSEMILDNLHISISTDGKLQYTLPRIWFVSIRPGEWLTYRLPIVLAPNDTSGIIIRAEGEGVDSLVAADSLYFVTNDTRCRDYRSDPHLLRDQPGVPPGGKLTTYKLTDWDKMKAKEQTPLTDADGEGIDVDGEAWTRNRGEYKFHKLLPMTNPDSASREASAKSWELKSRTVQKGP